MTARIRLPRPPQAPPAAEPPPRTWAELTERLKTLGPAYRRAGEAALGWAAWHGPDMDYADFPPEAVARCWEEQILPEFGHLMFRHPF